MSEQRDHSQFCASAPQLSKVAFAHDVKIAFLATLVAFFQFSPISCNHGYQLSRISQVIVSTIDSVVNQLTSGTTEAVHSMHDNCSIPLLPNHIFLIHFSIHPALRGNRLRSASISAAVGFDPSLKTGSASQGGSQDAAMVQKPSGDRNKLA
jgi:hypothetical protein